jgi:hypothetical protein
MKWWLKLYTIPTVQAFTKWLGLSVILDYVFMLLIGQTELSFAAYIIPFWAVSSGANEKSFRTNLEFHKMSVPFKELKKAFYTHLTIVFSSIVLTSAIGLMISGTFGGVVTILPHISFSQYVLFLIMGYVAFIYFNSFNRTSIERYAFYDSKISFFKKILRLCLTLIMGLCIVSTLAFLNVQPTVISFGSMLSILFGAALYYSRSLFHQAPARGGMKQYFGYSGLGFITCLSIFFMLAFLGKNDFQNKKLTSAERLKLNLFWQPVSASLDKDLFMELEPGIQGKMDSIVLYDAIDSKKLNQIPASFFIDAENPQRLFSYLIFGKPNAQNLTLLLDHMENQKEFWEKSYKDHAKFKNIVIQRWPANQKFPERHIAARLKWQELNAKESKPDAQRAIASEPE